MQASLLDWSPDEYLGFGVRNQKSRHRLHESAGFSEAALVDLFDRHPREKLGVFTMGVDPTRVSEWEPVEPGRASGADILRAIQRGRIFCNALHADETSQAIRELLDRSYAELSERSPSMRTILRRSATLIVSSPGIQVYYHMDVDPNILWHIRGRKRIWVYPPLDFRFARQEQLEEIFSGEAQDEDLPFSTDWDAFADCFELAGGDVISWPQSAPHRVMNDDLNVSLSTNYATPASDRRVAIQTANRRIVRRLGVRRPSVAEHGLRADLKCAALRLLRRVGSAPPAARPTRMARLAIDPDAPTGWALLPAPVSAAFR